MKIIKNHPLDGKNSEEVGILALIGYYASLEAKVDVELSENRDERFSLDQNNPKYEEQVADTERAWVNIQHRKNGFSEAKKACLECLQLVQSANFIRMVEESKKKKNS